MAVYENILDTILATSKNASYTGSAKAGDAFMDTSFRPASGGAWVGKTAAVIDGDGALAEAFGAVSSKQAKVAAQQQATRFKTVQAALDWVVKADKKIKTSSRSSEGWLAVRDAARRLARLLAKTPAQMEQDGASKIADYFNPDVVPAWAKQARADIQLIQKVAHKIGGQSPKTAALTKSDDDIKNLDISDADIKGWVRKQLNQGVEPKTVADKLHKMADLQLFNKSIATDYLNNHAGTLGYAYMEPNHYMNDCQSTASRMTTKLGGVKAHSIKQIAACTGCQNFKKSAGMKTCSLYRLPIVANGSELMPIINNLVPGAKNKQAALTARANGEDKKIAASKESQFGRNTQKAHSIGLGSVAKEKEASKTAATDFTVKTVLAMHNSGQSLAAIVQHGSKVAGVIQTKKVVRDFVKNLRANKTKIALTQIDCTKLAGKLGASNQIHGESKCASCTYRADMHCGLTGGTLVTFPGMKHALKTASVKHATDGLALAEEFGMNTPVIPTDIELLGPPEDVSFDGMSRMDV